MDDYGALLGKDIKRLRVGVPRKFFSKISILRLCPLSIMRFRLWRRWERNCVISNFRSD